MPRGWDGWWSYEPREPRPAKDGIKAKSQRGSIGETWWSTRFIHLLESFGLGTRLTRGRSYARMGQVMDLRIKPGLVTSNVQGSRPRPYAVKIGLEPLNDAQWDKALAAMAEQAIFMAKLLAGEMPTDIEEAFATAKVSLFPKSVSELDTDCSCPDYANPCKHIAATFYILAEAFDRDPFLIFAFRGQSKEHVIGQLRGMRTLPAQDEAQTSGAALMPQAQVESPPLASCIENFWRAGEHLADLRVRPVAAEVPDAVLRQLGPAPIAVGNSNLAEYLADAYAVISRRAADLTSEENG